MSRKEYQVRVHVIEARELKGRDDNMSDPVVSVQVFGEKQRTSVKKKTLNPVFDELFFWDDKVSQSEFATAKCQITVSDANTIFKDVVIGKADLDLSFVYKHKGHEVFGQWLALTDSNNNNTGIQGYLRVTVVVLGPGDEARTHAPEELDDPAAGASDLSALVLKPPNVKQVGWELKCHVYRAESLTAMDTFSGKSDPFVAMNFLGATVKSQVKKKDLNPTWNETLVMPVYTPTMSNAINVQVLDWDRGSSDELIGEVFIMLSEVQNDPPPVRWYNLYGPAPGSARGALSGSGGGKHEDTDYRGRVMLGFEIVRKEKPELHTMAASPIQDPATAGYTLRCDVFEATELNSKFGEMVHVEVSCGTLKVSSKGKLSTGGGTAGWFQQLDELKMIWPAEMVSVPDIYVSVWTTGALGKARLGYLRFQPSEPEVLGFSHVPTWYELHPDKASGTFKPDALPGSVLVRLDFGFSRECLKPRAPMRKPATKPYQLRAHIYQARGLPPADANGTSDPYVVVRGGRARGKTKRRDNTNAPRWYETVTLDVELAQPLNLAQPVIVEVMDYDKFDADDLIGRFAAPPLTKIGKKWPGDPKWYKLYMDNPKVATGGSVLASFQLVPKAELKKFPVPKITPQTKECTISMNVLGLRNLPGINMLPVTKPYITFDIGDGKPVKTKVAVAERGSCNHLEHLTMKAKLPLNPLYCPSMSLRVYEDRLLGGKTLVGARDFNLTKFLPWTTNTETVGAGVFDEDASEEQGKEASPGGEQAIEAAVDVTPDAIPSDIDQVNEQASTVFEYTSRGTGKDFIKGVRTLPETAEVVPEGGDDDDDDDDARENVAHELEKSLGRPPIQAYNLFRGQARGVGALGKLLGGGKSDQKKPAGTLKGVIRVHEGTKNVSKNLTEGWTERKLKVRVYISRGITLFPKDDNGSSDPYLVLKVGSGLVINDKEKSLQKATLDPVWYRYYELDVTVPGPPLRIEVWDWDMLSGDDLIGHTTIDLDNRWFNEVWQQLQPKPMETRTLWSPTSKSGMGKLEMFMTMHTPSEAAANPPLAWAPPQPQPFELRVVVWNAAEVVLKDTDMSDVLVIGMVNGGEKQKSDVHWRSTGDAAFNWRFVFPLELPSSRTRLTLQIYDRDVISANDIICEAVLNLAGLARKAAKGNRTASLTRQWVTMTHPNFVGTQGKLELQIDLLPAEEARVRPAGLGRKPPNDNPPLPEPDRPDSFAPWRVDRHVGSFLKRNKWKMIALSVLGVLASVAGPLFYLFILAG